jgi:hypothetical protein
MFSGHNRGHNLSAERGSCANRSCLGGHVGKYPIGKSGNRDRLFPVSDSAIDELRVEPLTTARGTNRDVFAQRDRVDRFASLDRFGQLSAKLCATDSRHG